MCPVLNNTLSEEMVYLSLKTQNKLETMIPALLPIERKKGTEKDLEIRNTLSTSSSKGKNQKTSSGSNGKNSEEVNVLLTIEKIDSDKGGCTKTKTFFKKSVQVFMNESIQHLKFRLRNRGYFTKDHCFVFGDRKLLESETVGQLISQQDNNSDHLHIFVRLSDVEDFEVITDNKQMQKNYVTPVSALTCSLQNQKNYQQMSDCHVNSFKMKENCSISNVLNFNLNVAERQEESALMLRGRLAADGEETKVGRPWSSKYMINGHDSIIHLVIRRSSSRVHWHLNKGKFFDLTISSLDTIDSLKNRIKQIADDFTPEDHTLIKDGYELKTGISLAELGVKKGDTLEVIPLALEEYPQNTLYNNTLNNNNNSLSSSSNNEISVTSPKRKMSENWEKAKDALAGGVMPKLTGAGSGGSYFISAKDGNNVAVFKPQDEEPLAPNNPKGRKGSPMGEEGLRRGTRPGEGATREVIAFILDHDHFAGVPPTAMVSLSGVERGYRHTKVGSFQKYVNFDSDCEEMGPSKFPIQEVHKICVLDIRLGNTDRNGGNILAKRNEETNAWQLTPIDHGYCLPDTFEDINFEWMNWSQAKTPFYPETKNYIDKLDVNHDLSLLNQHGLQLRKPCERVFRVCNILLKKAVAYNLTPYQIGSMMCRQTFRKSPLERMHKRALQLSIQEEFGPDVECVMRQISEFEVDDEVYLKHMRQVIEEYMAEFVTNL